MLLGLYCFAFSHLQGRTKLLSVELGEEIAALLSSTGDEEKPRVVLRFGHAETVMPLFVFFGLFRDSSPLLHTASPSERGARQWNTSKICPFQANIAFYVASCAGKQSVVVQVNERTVETIELEAMLRKLELASRNRSCTVDKSIHGSMFGC